jgi:hypothetical protein
VNFLSAKNALEILTTLLFTSDKIETKQYPHAEYPMLKQIVFAIFGILTFGAWSCAAQDVTVIDYSKPVPVVTRPSYDSLSEQTKTFIDRESYEKNRDLGDYLEKSARKPSPQLLFQSHVCRNLDDFRSKLNVWNETPQLFASLELTENQVSEIDSLLKEHSAIKNGDLEGVDMRRIESDYHQRLSNVFLPFQIEVMASWNLAGSGLPKLLTTTAYGEVIGLSAEQKERIEAKSKKLADEINDFIEAKRMEAAILVKEELTTSQVERLEKRFDAKQLNLMSRTASLKSISSWHDFDEDQTKEQDLIRRSSMDLNLWNEPSEKKLP